MRFKLYILMLATLLSLSLPSFGQEVRVVYFHPNDRDVPNTNNVDEQLHTLIQRVRVFFERQVGKSFEFEKYANGKAKVHYFPGKDNAGSYRDTEGINGQTIYDEIKNSDGDLAREMSSYLYLIAADLTISLGTNAVNNVKCGEATYLVEPSWWRFWDNSVGPWAVVDISPDCFYPIEQQNLDEAGWERRVWITAHELGHAFGLGHDFRDSNYVMSYGGFNNGNFSLPNQLSPCAAKWLESSRFFDNASFIAPDQEAEIEFASKPVYSQNTDGLRLQFEIRDADGLYQAHLHVRQENTPPGYLTGYVQKPQDPTRDARWQNSNSKLTLYDCKPLESPTETIEFIYLKLTQNPLYSPKIQLRVIDLRGNITKKEFTLDPDDAGQIADQTRQTGDSSPSSDVNNVGQDTRLRATLKGHTDFVTSVAFSPNGRTLASGSWDDTIRLWNPRTAEHLRTLIGHLNNVTSVAFHPNGTYLASGSWDTKIGVWDVNPGHTGSWFYKGKGGFVTSVAYLSTGGQRLAWGSEDNVVRVTARGSTFPDWSSYYWNDEHDHDISSLAFSPDGRTLASGSWDNSIILWDSPDDYRASLTEHTDFVTSVAFSPNGKILASGSWDNTVRLWEVASQESIAILEGHTDRVLSVAFSPDGRTLASGSDDQTIRLWDVATERQRDTLLGHTSGVTAVAFSPDRRTLASAGGWDNTVRLWDLSPAPTPVPTVKITPSPVVSPAVGENLVIKVDISGVHNVAGYQATVGFDPTALRYVESANGTYLPTGSLFVPPVVNANQVTIAATSLSGDGDGAGTLATLTFEVVAVKPSQITLSDVMIMEQDLTSIPIVVKGGDVVIMSEEALDVNGDGVVNIHDLTVVASHFGKVGQNQADVNGDSVVDIKDLLLVAGGLTAGAAAPSAYPQAMSTLTAEDIRIWISEAQRLDLSDAIYQRGILMLELLMETLTPKETALLPNYPNPFNPETWIPYHLSNDADVQIEIYDMKGVFVRRLDLGHKMAGYYTDRTKAAYWDGRNALGETITSGVYFYHLSAGDYSATRRMLILK